MMPVETIDDVVMCIDCHYNYNEIIMRKAFPKCALKHFDKFMTTEYCADFKHKNENEENEI